VDAASVIFYVFLVGGAFAVVEQTGALGRLVNSLVRALSGRGLMVIPVAALTFGAGGVLIQMQEELIAFVPMLLLLTGRLGFTPLVAVAMSVWPIVGMFGFMGLTGHSMDIQSILLAPLAVGFAVDNAVHFLHYFRLHFRRHRDVDAALSHAFEQKGRAILGSSGALLVGFAVLLLGYMGSTRSFGLLAVVVVCLSLLANLLLLPALLRTVYRPRPRVHDPERASSYDMTFSEFF